MEQGEQFIDNESNSFIKFDSKGASLILEALRFYCSQHSDEADEKVPPFESLRNKINLSVRPGHDLTIQWESDSRAGALSNIATALEEYSQALGVAAQIMKQKGFIEQFAAIQSDRDSVIEMTERFKEEDQVNQFRMQLNGSQDG